MASSFSSIRSAAVDGRLHNPFYRKNQLKLVHDKLSENSLQIQQAILEDTGYRSSEIKLEFWLALQCLADNFAAIDPENVLRDEYSIARDEDVPDGQEPVGIVVIEPASHAFLYCLVSALGPALATGNCVIVQVSIDTRYTIVYLGTRGSSG
jgi:acyl-CoA reductase-like NAD-dependent aldehyde dehydrogenase